MKDFKKNIWLYATIGTFIGFGILITGFTLMASRHPIDLVITDYYKAEIDYQKQINKQKNYNALVTKPVIDLDSVKKSLSIVFPGYTANDPLSGRICFYRPNNEKEDDTVALHVNDKGLSVMSLSSFSKGQWKMRMDWQQGATQYYLEKSFRLE